jgi:hypothetical protein
MRRFFNVESPHNDYPCAPTTNYLHPSGCRTKSVRQLTEPEVCQQYSFKTVRELTPASRNPPVFSDAADVQEGFSATGSRCFGPRRPSRLHAFDFFASTLNQ